MEVKAILKSVDEIISLYKNYGNQDYIGEPVSQVEHMCQCAQLAEKEGHDNEVVLAAFLHDIGHLLEHLMPVKNMDGYGIVDHEKIGATYLSKKGFSDKITKLVASHVQAKRYLSYKYPEYLEQLSEASKKTLTFQGGLMSEEEARDFENDEFFSLYVLLRSWDEHAKQERLPLPDLNVYRKMIIQHLMNRNP
ncbi:MAG: phosphonate degradation HD-domain oxygenase [Ginsengibacter sp.]